ncbi:MAG: hypothetical protein JWO57_3996 [Pseudonocardiales bacterium]|nr:hypothetical protein [Pseudonocardiales bacterium]
MTASANSRHDRLVTTAESPVRRLADTLVETLLMADPFAGTALGLREYDALVPDPSAAAEDQLATRLAELRSQADSLTAGQSAERVTLGVVRGVCEYRRLGLDNRDAEFTVSAMPLTGPPALFAVAARTTLPDPEAAADYLTRLGAASGWIDATAERLREGRAKGRLPVGELVDQAIAWADRALADPVPVAFTAPPPPPGWGGASEWRAGVESVVAGEIMPAVARWRDLLVELRPSSRPEDRAGIGALPHGDQAYRRAIAVHTTLTLSAEELHQIGLAAVAALEERASELGASVGLTDLAAVVAATRASSSELDANAAIDAARSAIRRAEARAGELMPLPLPDPCAVEPMPPTVAESGMAPHYTRPRLDGSRPGTFWFNTMRPTAGRGWDLEAVAFHEAVPGHHAQLARLQQLPDLPLLQQLSTTVHSEGWGLYAERLADELGLYSDARAQIGAVYMELHRAARLVVDTGLHAFGWSRTRAIQYMVEHVALPEAFLVNEVDRYIAWPGQALAYLTGQREILRLREQARAALGATFDLPGFHAALLDSGSVPMPVLADVVAEWVTSRADGSTR